MFMRSNYSTKHGMTIVEMFIVAFVASILLLFFVSFFGRTRKVHEQQTLEIVYQRTFTKLCEQLERDLTGCMKWDIQNMVGYTSLEVKRLEDVVFLYTVNLETGLISRELNGISKDFPFKGEKKGILKRVDFIQDTDNPNGLRLKIELKTVPPIELSQDFLVRISEDKVKEGFFDETVVLDERGAGAELGIKK